MPDTKTSKLMDWSGYDVSEWWSKKSGSSKERSNSWGSGGGLSGGSSRSWRER